MKLTVTEACRLQTLPDDYCRAVSATQAYRGLGNGWTAEVIIHLLSYALAGVPKDEEIVVLSMYDGIGTGRYCFDKLGYTNVRYYATEIDKHAMRSRKAIIRTLWNAGTLSPFERTHGGQECTKGSLSRLTMFSRDAHGRGRNE